MNTLINRDVPKPYRIFKNLGDSDFIFYYAGSFPRLVSLRSKMGETHNADRKRHTYLIIQEIEKLEPNLSQLIDVDAKEINLDYK